MARVEIFYAQMCGLCHKAMDYFRDNGIPFDAYELTWGGDAFVDSEHTRDLYRRLGGDVDYVPQIFIDGKHIAGWKTLSAMIESGELRALLGEEKELDP